MNFRLESYDPRRNAWDDCTLFRDDFVTCVDPAAAQTLLDRVAAAYASTMFRVCYDSVLTPGDSLRLNTADQPKAIFNKKYTLQFRSKLSNIEQWFDSGLLNFDPSKCRTDEEAKLLLAEVKQLVPDVRYRVEVSVGESEFAKYILE